MITHDFLFCDQENNLKFMEETEKLVPQGSNDHH
jgi:hypothetical protein